MLLATPTDRPTDETVVGMSRAVILPRSTRITISVVALILPVAAVLIPDRNRRSLGSRFILRLIGHTIIVSMIAIVTVASAGILSVAVSDGSVLVSMFSAIAEQST